MLLDLADSEGGSLLKFSQRSALVTAIMLTRRKDTKSVASIDTSNLLRGTLMVSLQLDARSGFSRELWFGLRCNLTRLRRSQSA
jgi:hypothetical protein